MLCEQCGQRPATVHITRIVNNQKSELSLCQECASIQQGSPSLFGLVDFDFSIQKFLAGLLAQEPARQAGPDAFVPREMRCHRCGLSYERFRETGRLGCDECYTSFDRQLQPLLRRLHGSVQHAGKVPRKQAGRRRLQRDLEVLRRELQELVAKEEFEKAAELRDRIRALERQQG